VTVTDPAEAVVAERAGADALVAQGTEAGGHRGYFEDSGPRQELGLLALLRLILARSGVPVIAAGGIMDGPGIAAVDLVRVVRLTAALGAMEEIDGRENRQSRRPEPR
jgi:nitronate monooxygenase